MSGNSMEKWLLYLEVTFFIPHEYATVMESENGVCIQRCCFSLHMSTLR